MQTFNITGMSCAACSSRVESCVNALSGVDECSVNLLTNSMTVSGNATAKEIITAVQKAGYGASLKGEKKSPDDDTPESSETKNLKQRLFSSLGFLALLMYVSMGHTMWHLEK